jgi:mRNA interferase MazF
MIAEGQVVLFRFPQTDLKQGKLRPALVIRKVPGQYNDWLICMVSSQLAQEIPGFDEIIAADDPGFENSGLKVPSLLRLGRLAVVNDEILLGKIGGIDSLRLVRIKEKLSIWIRAVPNSDPGESK